MFFLYIFYLFFILSNSLFSFSFFLSFYSHVSPVSILIWTKNSNPGSISFSHDFLRWRYTVPTFNDLFWFGYLAAEVSQHEEMTSFVFLWQSKVIPSQKADLSWLSPRSGGNGRSDVQPGQFFVSHRFSTVQVDGSYRAGLMQYLDLSDRGYYPDAEQTGSFSRHLLPRADLFDSVKKFGPVR